MQVTPPDRPLPRGEGRGEGLKMRIALLRASASPRESLTSEGSEVTRSTSRTRRVLTLRSHPTTASLRGCEEIELTDVDGSPSPHPSPAGRGMG